MRSLFIQCQPSQAAQAPPFNFPTIMSVQSPDQFGRTAPPLRKVTVYPARLGWSRGHSAIPVRAWVLLVP